MPMLGLSFYHQPLKGLYITYSYLNLWFVRIPYWTLRYLFPGSRIRPSWTLVRCLRARTFKFLLGVKMIVGGNFDGFGRVPDHTRLETNRGELGLYIDGVPELIKGDLASWASKANVEPTIIPGYWQHQPSSSSSSPPLTMGSPPHPGERVLLHLHGGAFVAESAHPSTGTMRIPHLLMSHTPSIHRVFSPEYRKALPNSHPFPTQLIDALAAYAYLVHTVGFSPAQIILSGDSAGANLALALTRYLLSDHPEVGLGPPKALVLLSCWADLTSSHNTPGSSFETNIDADYLPAPPNGGEGDYAPAVYAGALTVHGHAFLSSKYISPAAMTCEDWDFKGFPRTYVGVGGAELFLDANLELVKRMRRDLGEEGVRLNVTPDAVHDFLAFEWWTPERDIVAREIAEWIEAQ